MVILKTPDSKIHSEIGSQTEEVRLPVSFEFYNDQTNDFFSFEIHEKLSYLTIKLNNSFLVFNTLRGEFISSDSTSANMKVNFQSELLERQFISEQMLKLSKMTNGISGFKITLDDGKETEQEVKTTFYNFQLKGTLSTAINFFKKIFKF